MFSPLLNPDGDILVERVQAVLEAGQSGQIGSLSRPRAGVVSFQMTVISQKAGGKAAQGEEVSSFHEDKDEG